MNNNGNGSSLQVSREELVRGLRLREYTCVGVSKLGKGGFIITAQGPKDMIIFSGVSSAYVPEIEKYVPLYLRDRYFKMQLNLEL